MFCVKNNIGLHLPYCSRPEFRATDPGWGTTQNSTRCFPPHARTRHSRLLSTDGCGRGAGCVVERGGAGLVIMRSELIRSQASRFERWGDKLAAAVGGEPIRRYQQGHVVVLGGGHGEDDRHKRVEAFQACIPANSGAPSSAGLIRGEENHRRSRTRGDAPTRNTRTLVKQVLAA